MLKCPGVGQPPTQIVREKIYLSDGSRVRSYATGICLSCGGTWCTNAKGVMVNHSPRPKKFGPFKMTITNAQDLFDDWLQAEANIINEVCGHKTFMGARKSLENIAKKRAEKLGLYYKKELIHG